MPKPAGRTMSLTQAAATLGVHRNTMSDWLAKGCPAVTRADRARGVDWELEIAAIFDWRTAYLVREAVASYQCESGQVTKDEADRRRAVANAITAEIEADAALDTVVARVDAEAAMAAFCQSLKTGLGNATHKIAGRAGPMTSAAEIQQMAEVELNRAFTTARETLARTWGRPS